MPKQKITITLKPYHHPLIHQSPQKILQTPKPSPPHLSPPIPLPTQKSLYTILPPVHNHKHSPQQFQQPTHKPLIHILNPTPKTLHPLIPLNLPSPVHIQIKL
ncbi:30S ribosomal protein S10 [Staphylococcus epidermidis]|uniref:30S ribosomal protein S10 n=1 Tax=Staphylococcus epidermidis TaxID=1282 RepID=UPI00119E5883|nr:30S ribosomal protein S10 [Staphylococcus epidermidis]